MTGGLYALTRPFLHAIDAETAHGLAIRALDLGLVAGAPVPDDPRLHVCAFGLDFANPVGMAAGFDKNAEVPGALLRLGFGFVEVGTLTPEPQPGNPRPRIFRLPEDRAVINRLGFNNDGHAAARARLLALKRRKGVIGVNIGANKTSADRMADYERGVEAFHDIADYLVVNVSSPNTPGLRDLQAREAMAELIGRVVAMRDRCAAQSGRKTPVLVKIAPDLDEAGLADIADCCLEGGVDGAVVSNTTVGRPALRSAHANEAGGLSGAPLFALSTAVLARVRLLTEGRLPLIGVGGVSSPETAYEKIRAGATLVQVYTGFIYEGPGVVARIRRGLSERLERDGFGRLQDAVGSGAEDWARRKPED